MNKYMKMASVLSGGLIVGGISSIIIADRVLGNVLNEFCIFVGKEKTEALIQTLDEFEYYLKSQKRKKRGD